MTRFYTLSNGACAKFDDNDFDYILNYDGHGYKRLKTFHWWFDGATREEVADPEFRRSLDLRCVDGNANCYKNITPNRRNYTDEIAKSMMENIGAGFKVQPFDLRVFSFMRVPEIKKIVINDKTTIILWWDGTKTIVRPSENDNYDLEAAVCAAIAKKIYGTNSAFKRMIREKVVVQENKKKDEDPNVSPTNHRHVENNGFVSTKGEEDSVIYTGSQSLYNIDPNPATEGEEE